MTGRKREFLTQLYQLADAILLGAAFWLSHFLRSHGIVVLDFLPKIPPFSQGIWMLALLMPFGPLLLEGQGFYQPVHRNRLGVRLSQIFAAGVWMILLLGLCVIFLRLEVPSRSVLLLLAVLGPAFLLARDTVTEALYFRQLRKGKISESVIFAGGKQAINRLLRKLPPIVKLEFRIVQKIPIETPDDVSTLVEEIHRHSVGRVVFSFDRFDSALVQEAVTACEIEGVEAWMDASFIRTTVARPCFENLAGQPILVFRSTPELSWSLFCKAAMDFTLSAFLLILLSPLMLLIAALIKLTSPGPVFFTQVRSGLRGKKFVMYKFRSMYHGADRQRHELEALNEMKGPVFKLKNDPRVTPLGRILRKTSLDELPQLWNVLRGEMSLVGPRPLPDYEVAKFDEVSYRRRLSVKPGITGLWQVKGRSDVKDFSEWIRLDLEYIDNWSLGLDIMILLQTIPAVLRGRGAA